MKIRRMLSRIAMMLLVALISDIVTPAFSRAEETVSTLSQSTASDSQQLENTNDSLSIEDVDSEKNDSDQSDGQSNENARDFTNIVRQTTEYTCGPAALATLIGLVGGNGDEMQLANLSGTTDEKGTTLLGLKKAAKSLGYDVSLKNIKLDNLNKYKLPVLAHENNKEDGDHYIVIKEITNSGYKIADPSAGNIEIGKDDFLNSFTGKILMLSLPSEVKDGQSASVALQILENKGVGKVSVDGKIVDIDDLQDQLSDQDAENTNGKFVLVDDLGFGIFLIGSAVVFIGSQWMLSKQDKAEKGFKSILDEVSRHVGEIKKDPCRQGYQRYPKEISDKINDADKKFDKCSNKFKNKNKNRWKEYRKNTLKEAKKAQEKMDKYWSKFKR